MVRTVHPKQNGFAQWLRAWTLLPIERRLAIIAFCARADADVADAVLKL